MHSTLTRAKSFILRTSFKPETKHLVIRFLKCNKIYCITTQYKLVVLVPRDSLPLDFIAYGIQGLPRFLTCLLHLVEADNSVINRLVPCTYCPHNYVDGSDGEFKVGRRCCDCEIACC